MKYLYFVKIICHTAANYHSLKANFKKKEKKRKEIVTSNKTSIPYYLNFTCRTHLIHFSYISSFFFLFPKRLCIKSHL